MPKDEDEENSNASEILDIQEMQIDEEKEDTTEEKADPDNVMTTEERKFYDEAMEYMDTMVEDNRETAIGIKEEETDMFKEEEEEASQDISKEQDNIDNLSKR